MKKETLAVSMGKCNNLSIRALRYIKTAYKGIAMILQVRQLKPGMILLRDLVHDGNILLKSNSTLSAPMISVLKIRDISHVDVKETDEHAAPGADIYYKRVINSANDIEYQQKKHAIEKLFSTAETDEQTLLLKYCITRQLEENRVEPD